MITNQFIDHFLRFQEARDTDEIVSVCAEYLETAGFHTFNYGFADTRDAPIETAPVDFITTCRSDWMERYGDRRYDLLDPGVDAIRKGDPRPTFIRAEIDRQQADENNEMQTYLDELFQAGGRSVVISPLRSPFLVDGSGFAGIGLMSSLAPDEFSKLWADQAGEVLLFINAMHEKMSPDVRRRADRIPELSPRERDCLAFLSEGLRPQEIADCLLIASPTVNLYITRMRKKLHARTNAEAVAKALSYGLL